MRNDLGLIIDAVITWVDGNDPAHRAKRMAAMAEAGLGHRSNATYETRFLDNGEIYYCIASILKYAPFIRHIYVVTDNQKPTKIDDFALEGICDKDRIRIVDHKEILAGYDQAMPTFNSLTLESVLWRIEELSDVFLYCNDDFFLNAPLSPDSVIDPDGRLIVRGRARKTWPLHLKYHLRKYRARLTGRRHISAHYKTAQVLGALMAGDSYYVELGHTGHFLRKGTFRAFFEKNPDVLEQQVKHRFRSIAQFLPVSLANHLELRSGGAKLLPELESCYIKPTNFSAKGLREIARGKSQWGCVQSLDEFPPDDAQQLRQALNEKFRSHLPGTVIARSRSGAISARPAGCDQYPKAS